MKCVVGSMNPVKVGAAKNAMSQVLACPTLEVTGMSVPSGVADQPMTNVETRAGAINRVKACIAKEQADWYIAIEGGVEKNQDGPFTFAYVAISDGRKWSVGRSAGLPLPNTVYDALLAGEELGTVMDRLFATENVKQKGGAIGLLTKNLATRQSVYELAVTLTMAKFSFANLYQL